MGVVVRFGTSGNQVFFFAISGRESHQKLISGIEIGIYAVYSLPIGIYFGESRNTGLSSQIVYMNVNKGLIFGQTMKMGNRSASWIICTRDTQQKHRKQNVRSQMSADAERQKMEHR